MRTSPMSGLIIRPRRLPRQACCNRSGDQARDLLGTRLCYRLLGHLARRAGSTATRSATGEDVRHAVADQHDRDALVAQAPDEIEDLDHLANRDRRRGLVHQHDLGLGQAGPRNGDGLALSARHPADDVARPGLRFELADRLAARSFISRS